MFEQYIKFTLAIRISTLDFHIDLDYANEYLERGLMKRGKKILYDVTCQFRRCVPEKSVLKSKRYRKSANLRD